MEWCGLWKSSCPTKTSRSTLHWFNDVILEVKVSNLFERDPDTCSLRCHWVGLRVSGVKVCWHTVQWHLGWWEGGIPPPYTSGPSPSRGSLPHQERIGRGGIPLDQCLPHVEDRRRQTCGARVVWVTINCCPNRMYWEETFYTRVSNEIGRKVRVWVGDRGVESVEVSDGLNSLFLGVLPVHSWTFCRQTVVYY